MVMLTPELALLDRRMCALQGVSFLPGTAAKRFVRDVCGRPATDVSERQRIYIEQLCHKFRRQLPASLVPAAPPTMPPKPPRASKRATAAVPPPSLFGE